MIMVIPRGLGGGPKQLRAPSDPIIVCCMENIPNVHHLLASKTATTDSIQLILGHEQALGQCRHWLDSHLPDVAREAVASNGEAARRAASESGVAAIAGELAAGLHGLKPLARTIQDSSNNTKSRMC